MVVTSWLMRHPGYCVSGIALACAAPLAAHADTLADARARYQQDMAVCSGGQSSQEPGACRLEARNALAEVKRGGLNDMSPDQYRQNALQRCNVHQGDDRAACEARMRGEGHVEGSVEGGGVLREIVTVVPGQ